MILIENNYTELPKKREMSSLTKSGRYVVIIPFCVKPPKNGFKKKTLKFFIQGLIFRKITLHHVNLPIYI